MFIGKWNKSVILTYIGVAVSILGMLICFSNIDKGINIAMACLIIAGVCDMFDGTIARKCKRTEEEKNFGIELDSLADVIDFIALPSVIFLKLQMNTWYHYILITIFAICGVARLAYFNIKTADDSEPVKYYYGLPVTYSAMIFPLLYFLKYILPINVFSIFFTLLIPIVALFNILNIKFKKPKGILYILLSLLAIISLIFYLGVL